MGDGMKASVAVLFIVFGWSSWIDIGGLWMELPLMVHRLPEGWNLPAYLSVISQPANIGPLLYTSATYLLKRYKPGSTKLPLHLETVVNFFIIAVGALTMLTLAFLWDKTSIIGGVEHSTVLLALALCVSTVDMTSSVTFLPFLAHFKPSYLTAYYVGEGMSGLIPTAIAFIQGSGEYTCVNVTVTGADNSSSSSIQPQYADLLFSVRDFFLTLFVMLFMSMVAFALLRFANFCKEEQVDKSMVAVSYQVSDTSGEQTTISTSKLADDEGDDESVEESLSSKEYYVILLIMALVSGLKFGALSPIMIYSLLPYGQLYYSVGVKLATLFNPIACFLGFFVMSQSFVVIGVLTCISVVTAAYIIVIASFSPSPPLEGAVAAVCMVMVWIVFSAVSAYLRLMLSKLAMRRGRTGLLWMGMCGQLGVLLGSVTTFLCTTVFGLLKSAPTCYF